MAGISLPIDALEPLGAPFFMLPGIVSLKIHLWTAEVPRGAHQGPFEAPHVGDGSPLEEGAELRWRGLHEAIGACERGEIEDAISEIAYRRLAARLATRAPA